ncbi:polycystin-2-like [Saccostrea cucullata]|uniref:polycystin-2-like n=1 Tax=Saccostrea cuccullata TaxID=36930 RepID=UPI002ED280ED
MNPVETVCYSEFYFLDSTNENFCKDWTPDNGSCFDDNEAIDISFRFRTSDELKTLPYVGVFSVYGGGGYKIDIGPKQSLAMDYLSQLKSLNWIDLYTRAVFVDTFLFNANTRLFTNIKVVFEISEFGSMEMKTNTYSFNMFPYITPWDYCVLIFQLLFIIIVAARFVFLVVNIVKLRLKSFSYFATYLRMAEIVLSVSAVILYILRIDQTLQGVTDVGNYLESHVSFEFAMMYDQLYQEALAVVMFIVSLDLLKPLTFNSHLHILYSSLSNGRKELLSYMLLFMIAISAFASYLHITTGYLVYDFRNPFTAILTLMQILLSMISLKKHPEISSLQAQIVISIFAFVMTLVFLNFFISVLNFYFSEGKENLEKSSQFLKHLNDHFWWRCNRFSKEFWRTISCQKLQTQDDQIEELLRLLKSVRILFILNPHLDYSKH